MERRRVAVVLAGIVLVGGGVVALRVAGGTPGGAAQAPAPPVPTSLSAYSAEGVLVPTDGGRPARPGRLVLTPGPHRMLATWRAARGAGGYDVTWRVGSAPQHDMLVAQAFAELADLPVGTPVTVAVRSVDPFGRHSPATTAVAAATPDPPAGADDALVDEFTGTAPNPALWQVATADNCAQAGTSGGLLEVVSQCGQAPVTLRSRAPLRLRSTAADGELGRFTIDTDSPGENGELDIDLVPGPVTMIDGSPNDAFTPTTPDVAAVDPDLPPGTVRVRIVSTVDSDTDVPSTAVQVAAGPGTRTVPVAHRHDHALPRPMAGVPVRWDVVLRTDGVEVLRDGVVVAGGNVVPQWTDATPLAEFSGPSLDQQRVTVDMIGMGGAPTKAPPLIAGPRLNLGAFPVVTPGSAAHAVVSHDTGPGSALLRLTVLVSPANPTAQVTVHGVAPKFSVRLGGTTFAATPAVPGTRLLPEVRYPLVARIPAATVAAAGPLDLVVVVDAPTGYPAQVSVLSADLDIAPGGRSGPDSAPATTPPLSAQQPQLGSLSAQLLDASGHQPPPNKPFPRGRGVLAVTVDGVATQRTTGALAGMAGFEVWLDDKELATVPTDDDEPAIAGTWDVSINTAAEPAGSHTLDVRTFGNQEGVTFGEAFVTYQLGR